MPDLPDRFDPATVEAFRYVGWDFDEPSGRLRLRYGLDNLRFTEQVTLPPGPPLAGVRGEAFERVARLLWLAAGLSYYKAAAPSRVVVDEESLTEDEAAWASRLLVNGLGEFWFSNGLDPRRGDEVGPAWSYRAVPARAALSGLGLPDRPLVAVGGGKDSCVTVEAMRRLPAAPLLASVRRFPVIDSVIQASGFEAVHVGRTIDPGLDRLNRLGARNGHVPVTAIVALILLATALRAGGNAVVMSNERSASEANLRWAGLDVNHQWSKSVDFETDLAGLLGAGVTAELSWFSLLRPFSELRITQLFAATGRRYFGVFSSCNAAYRLDETRRARRWDLDCPKCRFVSLALAPFVSRRELVDVQGGDMLGDLGQLPGYLALVGANGPKPFECVGEVAESRVAVRLLSEQPEWRDAPVVAALARELAGAGWPADADVERVFSPDPAPLVPAAYRPVVDALAAADR